MPTGYTADVVNGNVTQFRDFALQCARAFGALISMRDDPFNAPIPDEFKPGEYSADRLAEAQAHLEKLRSLSPAALDRAAETAFQKRKDEVDEYVAQRRAEDARLEAMLEQVRAWEPPTGEHVELKKFMVDQINISKSGADRPAAPVKQTGQEWLKEQTEKALRDIEYHAGEQAKEIERAKGRTEWVRALKASLPADIGR